MKMRIEDSAENKESPPADFHQVLFKVMAVVQHCSQPDSASSLAQQYVN